MIRYADTKETIKYPKQVCDTEIIAKHFARNSKRVVEVVESDYNSDRLYDRLSLEYAIANGLNQLCLSGLDTD